MKPTLSLALALVLGVLGPRPSSAGSQVPAPSTPDTQEAAPPKSTFPTAVDLVTVDVVVVDKKGEPVKGLTQDDFVITEKKVPQNVTSFEAVVVRDAPAATGARAPFRPAPFSTNLAPQASQGRTFLVIFDDIHLSAMQAQRAKGAVAEFLRSGVAEGDRVTLIATGGGAWWNERMPEGRDQLLAILKRLDGRYVPDASPDRLTEYEAMRIQEYEDQQVAEKVQRRFDNYGAVGSQQDPRGVKPPDADQGAAVGIMPSLIRSRAEEVYNLSTSRNKVTLAVMTRAIEGLGATKGRKSMILVSQGFIYDVQLAEMRKVVDASTRANVPIYFIDTRGLQALPEAFTAAFGRPLEAQDTVAVLADITLDADGSASLALDTGGFVVSNSNDLVAGINRVSRESNAYYLLGYNPTDLTRDGKFRKIEVKLKEPRAKGLTIRARRGYYAPGGATAPTPVAPGVPVPGARSTKIPEMVRVLDSPFEEVDVPMRVSAFAFDEGLLHQMNVTVAAEIDVRKLGFEPKEGRLQDSVALIVEVQHRETGEYYRHDRTIEMSLLPETRDRLAHSWYLVTKDFSLPPGGYQARVVVRDMRSGHLGSTTHEFEVPPAGALRVSSPILSDTLEPAEDGVRRPVLRVQRAFARNSVLYCQFSVYGATRGGNGQTFMPQVSAGYEIRRVDGALFRRGATSRINPTSVGALLRLNGIPLAGAAPGEYELILNIRDELDSKAIEIREPFTVAGS